MIINSTCSKLILLGNLKATSAEVTQRVVQYWNPTQTGLDLNLYIQKPASSNTKFLLFETKVTFKMNQSSKQKIHEKVGT